MSSRAARAARRCSLAKLAESGGSQGKPGENADQHNRDQPGFVHAEMAVLDGHLDFRAMAARSARALRSAREHLRGLPADPCPTMWPRVTFFFPQRGQTGKVRGANGCFMLPAD